ncbi:response regulator [Mucilaginibacter jinjuensis]|uniref:Response regulator n=1 Tax=Mucilaginibacter jinjuensis TaxID=1176721 RepID=A0ABY7TF87_9SPHI|nr:response regulator [Mucilaginibacter jinjuensis]WCT14899.1 response regulator [Mucilaginibacter jinjuensis]
MEILQKKILIVDDNEDVLQMLKDLLFDEGYFVEGFLGTDDIIQLANQHKPDLVIIDYLLAGINGGEYCHQIKTDATTSHIPVIMLSAHPKVLNSLGNYGSDRFISKPFSIDEVILAVKELTEK